MKANRLFKTLVTSVTLTFIFIISISLLFSPRKITTANADTLSENEAYDCHITETSEDELIFSYKAVFRAYYENAKIRWKNENFDFVDFDTFCANYYTSELDISSYTESYFSNPNTATPYSSGSGSSSSSSPEEKYILSANKYDYTPKSEFPREPHYTEYLYKNLQNGDLVHETETSLNTGHTAIISDISHDSDYGKYCQTIEAVSGGVQYGFLDDDRVVSFGVKIYRARGFVESRHHVNLLYFLEKQLGKPYDLDILRQNKDIDSKKWYCSELAWAAYNYIGIDIGQVGGTPLGGSGNSGGCLPITIALSDNTYLVTIQGSEYLRMNVVSKTGSTWTIKITNNNYFDIIVSYNEKMCNGTDAKNFKNLYDRAEITIPRFSNAEVKIKENFFATHVTCCWSTGEIIYITYGNELRKNSSVFNVSYRSISVEDWKKL